MESVQLRTSAHLRQQARIALSSFLRSFIQILYADVLLRSWVSWFGDIPEVT